jgi:hypothetical protein
VGDPVLRLVAFARMHLTERECEHLVAWIAHRTGRAQALAGNRPAIRRLEHVARHWLAAWQVEALLVWMQRRLRDGQAMVPNRRPAAEPGVR